MSTNASDGNESIDPRTERALTECMSVLPEGGEIYTVVGQNGGTYTVDAREGRCTCPDHTHRGVRCKHQRRVAVATSERPIPAGVDGVDEQLAEHTDATPQVAATDGGIIDAGDGAEVLDDGRPDGCECPPAEEGDEGLLCCWACWQAGFRTAPVESDD